jgi:hypothetical protein
MFKHCSRYLLLAVLLGTVSLFAERSAHAQYTITYGAAPGFYPSGAYRSFYPTGFYPGYNPYGYVTPVGFPTYATYYTAGYRGFGYGAYNYSPYLYTTNYVPYTGYRTFYAPYPYLGGYRPYNCPYGFPCW